MKQITADLADEIRAAHYEKTGRTWLTVKTGSMEPLIRPGDLVLISSVTPGDIRRGEIIVFRRDGSLIGHRVMKKNTTGDRICFIDKGDNSAISGSFQESDVVGRVIAVRKKRRLLFFDNLPGLATNMVLFVWFSWTSVVHTGLGSSHHGLVNKLGAGLDRIFRLISSFLVRAFGIVWYLAGRLTAVRHEVNVR